jgi:lysophospholipase L1-like esterase
MALRPVACLLFALALPSVAGALPVVAGFGDSITCDGCNDGGYLGLLADYLEPDPILDDNGVSSDRTGSVLSRLQTWIDDGNTADVLVLLTGTPDTYQAVGGWMNRPYDPLETLGNIEDMIDLVLAESIPLILVAPPPVLDPCGNPSVLTCGDIDGRLADLADDLALVATTEGVPFVDLYAAFQADPRFGLIADGGEHPGPDSLFLDDGLHPRLATGDTLIASLLATEIALIIPEPSTAILLACGLLALAHRQRRKAA